MSGRPPSRRIVSTLFFPRRRSWTEAVESVTEPADGDERRPSAATVLRRLIGEAPRCDALVLDGAAHRDELAGLLLLARPGRPPLVFAEATWGPSGPLLDRVASKAVVRLLNRPRVYLCVLSTYELESFPRVWGFDRDRLFFTPFYATLSDEELEVPAFDGEGVFAGGDSLRDYRSLVSVAAEIPTAFTLATGLLGSGGSGLPPNVAAGRIPHDEFMQRLRTASVVVVPFERGIERSAGQQTYLNAMALGKIAVVTDGPGVRDYIDDGETGLVVDPDDPRQLAEAIRWAIDPNNRAEQQRIKERARATVLGRFMPEHYVQSLLGVLDQVLEEAD